MKRVGRVHNIVAADTEDGGGSSSSSDEDGKIAQSQPSSISSLSPPYCYTSSSVESAQFSIDEIDIIHDDDDEIMCDNSDDDHVMISDGGSESSRSASQHHEQLALNRPSNPPPPISGTSSPTTRSRRRRASSSSSSSVSLIQGLLKRSNQPHNVRPPRKIYLPIKHQQLDVNCNTNCNDKISPLMLPSSSVMQVDTSLSLSIQSTSNCPSSQKDTDNNDQMAISIAQYEQHTQLQSIISNLLSQQSTITSNLTKLNSKTKVARSEMIKSLAISGGNAKNEQFVETVNTLEKLRTECSVLNCSLDEVTLELGEKRKEFDELCEDFPSLSSLTSTTSQIDSEAAESSAAGSSTIQHTSSSKPPTQTIEGNWFTLTKPTYLNCLGNNNHGNPMYTLGRMSFEMFRPSSLVVSIDAVWNVMEEVDLSSILNKGGKDNDGVFTLPKNLIDEDLTGLRTYHIVTAFTIEPYSPSFGDMEEKNHPNSILHSPIRGIMTTYGYALPDPEKVDRLSVWFSGGKVSLHCLFMIVWTISCVLFAHTKSIPLSITYTPILTTAINVYRWNVVNQNVLKSSRYGNKSLVPKLSPHRHHQAVNKAIPQEEDVHSVKVSW